MRASAAAGRCWDRARRWPASRRPAWAARTAAAIGACDAGADPAAHDGGRLLRRQLHRRPRAHARARRGGGRPCASGCGRSARATWFSPPARMSVRWCSPTTTRPGVMLAGGGGGLCPSLRGAAGKPRRDRHQQRRRLPRGAGARRRRRRHRRGRRCAPRSRGADGRRRGSPRYRHHGRSRGDRHTRGRKHVAEATVAELNGDGSAGRSRRLACDLVAMSGGWSPVVHLFSQSRGRLRYDEALSAFLPGRGGAGAELRRRAGRILLDRRLHGERRRGRRPARPVRPASSRRTRRPPPEPEPSLATAVQPLWLAPHRARPLRPRSQAVRRLPERHHRRRYPAGTAGRLSNRSSTSSATP